MWGGSVWVALGLTLGAGAARGCERGWRKAEWTARCTHTHNIMHKRTFFYSFWGRSPMADPAPRVCTGAHKHKARPGTATSVAQPLVWTRGYLAARLVVVLARAHVADLFAHVVGKLELLLGNQLLHLGARGLDVLLRTREGDGTRLSESTGRACTSPRQASLRTNGPCAPSDASDLRHVQPPTHTARQRAS